MKLAIFGTPVGHSLSPAMHMAALEYIGVAGAYSARDVDLLGFRAGVAELRAGDLDGANVTMPYKRRAFELCDEKTEQAGRVGAVNTLFVRQSRLVGENTDVVGIGTAWDLRGLPDSGPIIILGAGGAAAAALVALAGRPQYVLARRPERAESLTARIGSSAVVIPWGEPIPPGVVVNATSMGMKGEALPKYLLESATGLFDMPYGETPTQSVLMAKRRSLPVADGLDMLVGQAVASFSAWTGVDVPATVFRGAAVEELKRRPGGCCDCCLVGEYRPATDGARAASPSAVVVGCGCGAWRRVRLASGRGR